MARIGIIGSEGRMGRALIQAIEAGRAPGPATLLTTLRPHAVAGGSRSGLVQAKAIAGNPTLVTRASQGSALQDDAWNRASWMSHHGP